ncbi:benzoate/H(+) symporter BenE family transporter [Arthrobacter sp. KK5.5]|uniref:benzoate/H(+) symporter BenE family transporter n=1 Tax=Arthrobacter sp. KK5.5 TaxID=3373084 RepID=UPI003EE7D8FD
MAWSTPGAALLATAGGLSLGWNEAVGAFLVCGLLIAVKGAVPALGRLVAAVPVPLAQAILGGVLFELCLAPFAAPATVPWQAAPAVLAWLVTMRWHPRWAVPVAMLVTLAVVGYSSAASGVGLPASALPRFEFTAPVFTLQAMAGIALPLFIVTMASQNVPGMTVLAGFGYRAPWSASMLATGAGTIAASVFGGHAVNLAAISAALAAGEEAGADRGRRWVAAVSSGVVYLLLGTVSAAVAALAAAAGLALLGTLGNAASMALADPAPLRDRYTSCSPCCPSRAKAVSLETARKYFFM